MLQGRYDSSVVVYNIDVRVSFMKWSEKFIKTGANIPSNTQSSRLDTFLAFV